MSYFPVSLWRFRLWLHGKSP